MAAHSSQCAITTSCSL